MKVRVNESFVEGDPLDENSKAYKEGKRICLVEIIQDKGVIDFFGSRVEKKTHERIKEAIPKRMLKLPFGVRILY